MGVAVGLGGLRPAWGQPGAGQGLAEEPGTLREWKEAVCACSAGSGLGNEARAEAGEACEGPEAVPGAGVSRLGQCVPHVCLLDICLWLESQERLGGGDQPEGCCLLASETGGCPGARGPGGGR